MKINRRSVNVVIIIALTMLLATAQFTLFAPQAEAQVILKVQLAMVLDGTGSILPGDWTIIKNGVADAVEKSLPHDGSVELTVVQFCTGVSESHDGILYYAKTEVAPTIITTTNYATIANAIRAIVQGSGTTPMADGVWVAWDDIRDSPNFGIAENQIINLATDGAPNVVWSDTTRTTGDPYTDVTAARNAAVEEGLDELDSEAIGAGPDIPFLRDDVVWPQPGTEAPPFTPGWVQWVPDADAFADAVAEKFKKVVPPELTIRKSSSPPSDASVSPGSTIAYTITYGNTGGSDATNVVIIDAIPTYTTYVTGSASGASTTITYSHDGGLSYDSSDSPPVTHIKWTRAVLPAGTVGETVSFKVIVNSSLEDGTIIEDEASIGSDEVWTIFSNIVTHIVKVPKPPPAVGGYTMFNSSPIIGWMLLSLATVGIASAVIIFIRRR